MNDKYKLEITNKEFMVTEERLEEELIIKDSKEILENVKKEFESLGFDIDMKTVLEYWEIYNDYMFASFMDYTEKDVSHFLYNLQKTHYPDKNFNIITPEDKSKLHILRVMYKPKYNTWNIRIGYEKADMKSEKIYNEKGYCDDGLYYFMYSTDIESAKQKILDYIKDNK